MKKIIRKISSVLWYSYYTFLQKPYLCLFLRKNRFDIKGKVRKVQFDISGGGNSFALKESSMLDDVTIRVRGNNNRIIVGEKCYLGYGCSIWAEGNNITVQIGNKCSFTHNDQICAQEDNSSITIGEDCMFSHHINIRTSDSHLIYSTETNERINFPKDVVVGRHVWIAPNSIIMKGVTIGDGCIVGSNTIVTKNIPSHSLAVGMPAKVVKQNVSWSRIKLF